MKNARTIKLNMLIALNLSAGLLFGQAPQIRSIDKTVAFPSQVVSITGTNFGTNPSQLAVFFGGMKGQINTATDQLLEVQAPLGATFNKINVVNTSTGLSSSSRESFFIDFGGTHPFSSSNLQSQQDWFAETGLYDHCLCDLDGDYKLDVATANSGSNNISILKNGSTVGNLGFTKLSPSVGKGTIHIQCGDLNGDGLPDLVASETNGGTHLYIFKNTGGMSFSLSTITLTGRKVKRIEIADLDGDGKPELVVTDQGNPSLIILPNTSSPAVISFGSAIVTKITGAASTDGLAIEDLNGDYLPEIITTQFLTGNGNATILVNQGSFNFSKDVVLAVPGTLVDLKVGDLDGDRLPEIVATQFLGSSVSVFLNQSATSLQFAAPVTFGTDDHPYGLDFGDIDGDGLLDIVVASITKTSVTVLNNNSSLGTLAFTPTIIPTTYINRHVKIGDMDGDAKPDITFTSVDDNNNNVLSSKVSILRNKTCMVPSITPGTATEICIGSTYRLNATVNGGTTYQWYKDGNSIPSATNSFYDVTAAGLYTVKATSEAGACLTTSNAVNITTAAGTTTGPANPTNNGPVCLNGTLQLNVADVGATQYLWNGPNGYTGSGLSPAPISNFTYDDAGRYYLDVYSGSCLVQQSSTLVQAVAFPNFKVSTSSAGVVCLGQNAVLTLVPGTSNVSYQWFEKTSGIISGQTSSTLTVSTTGSYFGKVTSTIYPACPAALSDTVSVTVVSLPVPDFTVDSTTPCTGQLLTFTDQSTSDPQTTANYTWDFGDGGTSVDQSPTHTYTSANSFTAKLTINYAGGICGQTKTKLITVQAAPALAITSSSGSFVFCEGETITLTATGTGFDSNSYQWNTSATSQSIPVTTDGTYSVSATATTSGCLITATQDVTTKPAPIATVSANPVLINEGQTSQLTSSGFMSYIWHPGKTLSDSTIANPVASPVTTTWYIVTGPGGNGCYGKDSVLVSVKGESITSKLKPKNFFSPGNGDNINEKWEVETITNYPQCGVTIFDEKGVKVYEAKPYLNNWEGTYNGHTLPVGVYYYIIRCDGDNTPKTGSITLVR